MERQRKTRIGRVVSDRMDKTVVIAVETFKRHPLYKKAIRRAIKYKAHDERNECQVGDTVRIVETRPLSKQKRWRVAEIITRGEVVEVEPEEIT
jgi:small subunit ribosomal protein S17